MLEQYKKIAIGESIVSFDLNYPSKETSLIIKTDHNGEYYKLKKDSRIKIPLNLEFVPSIVIVTFDAASFSDSRLYPPTDNNVTVNSEEHYVHDDSDIQEGELTTNTTANHYALAPLFIEEFDNQNVFVNVYFTKNRFSNSSYDSPLRIRGCRWIAIE